MDGSTPARTGMTLQRRLVLSFAALAALTLLLLVFATVRIAQGHATAQSLGGDWLPAVIEVADIRGSVNTVRRKEANHLLSMDMDEMRSLEKQMDELWVRMDKQVEALRRHPLDAAQSAQVETILKARTTYLDVQKRLLEFSRGGSATSDVARALFVDESLKKFERLVDEINKLTGLIQQRTDAAVAEGARTHDATLAWMAGIGLLAVALAVALVVLTMRAVARQLGGDPALAVQAATRVADGDLSVDVPVRPGDAASLMWALARMQDSLRRLVADVRENAESVASASGQIRQGNSDLSGRTEQQASALQETAASMKQLSSTVHQNAASAERGNHLAAQATDVAARGGDVVSQVVSTMKGINDSSRRIGDIIGTIDGIAFQTNILALNAAVEAARAGEQGRGFAVVASEVRSLAQRSADAAKEIKSLITASVQQAEQGAALADQAGSTMDEVVQAIRDVAQLMGEISAASREQSTGVAQVGEAVTQMDQATQQNAALVEQTAAAAQSLSQQAQQLVQAIQVFRLALRTPTPTPGTGARAPAAVAAAAPALLPAPVPSSAPAPRPSAVAKPAPARAPAAASPLPAAPHAAAAAGADDDWKSF